MKAIFTKYLGWTNTKPARIKAYDGDKSIVWSVDMLDNATRVDTYWEAQLKGYHGARLPAGSGEAFHYEAARRFVRDRRWNKSDGTLVVLAGGGTKEGYVWVMLD